MLNKCLKHSICVLTVFSSSLSLKLLICVVKELRLNSSYWIIQEDLSLLKIF